MKIFEREELLYESESVKGIGKSMSKLWKLAGEIKRELGDKGHYLDDYLSIIFKFIGSVDILNMVSMSESEYSEFWRTCINACKSRESEHHGKYSDSVKEHIKNHPAIAEDLHTQTAICFSEIMPSFLESIIHGIATNNKNNSSVKFKDAKDLHFKMSEIIGDDKVYKLDNLIKSTFIVCQFGDIISQEIMSHIAGSLSYEDEEHPTCAFKLIINENLN